MKQHGVTRNLVKQHRKTAAVYYFDLDMGKNVVTANSPQDVCCLVSVHNLDVQITVRQYSTVPNTVSRISTN